VGINTNYLMDISPEWRNAGGPTFQESLQVCALYLADPLRWSFVLPVILCQFVTLLWPHWLTTAYQMKSLHTSHEICMIGNHWRVSK
jgi:hypothetical protein